MNRADKLAVSRAKSGGKATAKAEPSAKPAADNSAPGAKNRIVEFIETTSDRASDQVADTITALIIEKSMQKIGMGTGTLTDQAIATFEPVWSETVGASLPALAASPEVEPHPKFSLVSLSPSGEETREEPTNLQPINQQHQEAE